MSENSYQNQDLESQNPLQLDPAESVETTQKSNKLILPSDPKIKLLIVLFGVVIILFIFSLIVTMFRATKTTPKRLYEPTPILTPRPSEIPATSNIPVEIKQKFDQVDKELQTNVNFQPPQIDTEVGL